MPRFKPDLPVARPRPRPVTLPEAIMHLANGLREELHHIAQAMQSSGSGSSGVTTAQFNAGIQTIMSKLSDFLAAQKAFNTEHAARLEVAVAAVDSATAAITDVGADVDNLAKQIADLQASSGEVTAEDQASIDAIQASNTAMGQRLSEANEKFAAAAAALQAVNDKTPPVVPNP